MQDKRTVLPGRLLPLLLIAPQLAVTLLFFVLPAGRTLMGSALREDPFGLSTAFVGLDNFRALLADPAYLGAFGVTLAFAAGTTALALVGGLVLAVLADGAVKATGLYRTLIVWPYAVAPAVAGVLWWYMFNPTVGVMRTPLALIGVEWNHFLNGGQALVLIVLASAWKQVAYCFLFYLAGLQSVPRALLEAAALDGAGAWQRFARITLPLLAPTTFFLLVINLTYAFCDTFGVVHATTAGGPGQATTTLVFKVFRDGFESLDLGSSSAQSVVLMALVGVLTVAQVRYVERRVHY